MSTWQPLTEGDNPAPYAPNQVEAPDLSQWSARVSVRKGESLEQWRERLQRNREEVDRLAAVYARSRSL